MTPETWAEGAPVLFTKNYVPSLMGATVNAGTKATVAKLRHGILGPGWSGIVALNVTLPDGRTLIDVPLQYLRH